MHGIKLSLTLSLFSLLFTITDVICWSMKMRIVANNAGTIAIIPIHHLSAFLVSGFMNQPRPGLVVFIYQRQIYLKVL